MKYVYNPDGGIDPQGWLAIDESQRLYLVQQYHRKKRVRLPNARLHAIIHVVVENQVAMGAEIPVGNTVSRLMREGLSRHDAIHAIGAILASRLYELMKEGPQSTDANSTYYRELDELSAESWLNSFNNNTDDE
jgi:hypothetical protein